MTAASAPELFYRKPRIPAVKQNSIDTYGDPTRLVDRTLVRDMDNLDKLDVRKCVPDLLIGVVLRFINNWMVFVFVRWWWAIIPVGVCSQVSKNVAIGGGTDFAILKISSSEIGPGPEGIGPTSPIAAAPIATATDASSSSAIQQIFTRVVTSL